MRHALLIFLMGMGTATASDGRGDCPRAPEPKVLSCMTQQLRDLKESARGLIATVRTEGSSANATLEELTYVKSARIRTYRALADAVPCTARAVQPNPDEPKAVLVCEDPNVVDAGYAIEVSSPDFAGVQWARVVENHFGGPRELARVPCQLQTGEAR